MLKNRLLTWPQYLVPQKMLSVIAGKLANCQQERVKNWLINTFIKSYAIDITEVLEPDIQAYPCFNDFFIRRLKPAARPLAEPADAIISPVDGYLKQMGAVTNGRIIQAKKFDYSLHELLGKNIERSELFFNGAFSTLYLAPHNYHRIHMPLTGTLQAMEYIPGHLFAVNKSTSEHIPRLFARNERVICIFETQLGPMAIILVGALLVGSINTVWHGDVNSPRTKIPHLWKYPNPKTPAVTLNRGDELGYFKYGSTVIMLFAADAIQWLDDLSLDSSIKMGQQLAKSC